MSLRFFFFFDDSAVEIWGQERYDYYMVLMRTAYHDQGKTIERSRNHNFYESVPNHFMYVNGWLFRFSPCGHSLSLKEN